jgi:membrane protein YqaA with SNARE-associated domain
MRLFGPLYDRCIVWAGHRHAPTYMAVLSAAESVVFPIPPDVMLAPMTLAKPHAWFRLALLCTVASVLGGLLGYLLGAYALDLVMPWIERAGKLQTFHDIQALFQRYGFWIVFVAGFTPIPYKVFTIASGATGIGLLPFIVGSIVGRGGRFFLVTGLIRLGGERMAGVLRRYVEWLGWLVIVLALVALAWLEWGR